MSKVSAALEVAVAAVIESTPKDGSKPTPRQRVTVDRAFLQILKLIAPRIRHFARQYGLLNHWEDAEQCCAIAVHRAIQAYDPAKAQFTTFVNWQIRGELQSLRFRLMTDQRPSAKKVEAATISLHSVGTGPEGEETTLESLLVDEESLEQTEVGASNYLAKRASAALMTEFVRSSRKSGLEHLRRQQPRRALAKVQIEGPRFRNPELGLDPTEIAKLDERLSRDCAIVERLVFGEGNIEDLSEDLSITKERARQIGKRAVKAMAELATAEARFPIMANYAASVSAPKRHVAPAASVGLLPDPGLAQNVGTKVVAIHVPEAQQAAVTATHVPSIVVAAAANAGRGRQRRSTNLAG